MDNGKKHIFQNPVREVEFYSYKFSDGKVYVGWTSHGIENRHREHKRYPISSVYEHLQEEDIFPKDEKAITIDIDSYDTYKIQREILDKYTSDTNQILNKNLNLLGY